MRKNWKKLFISLGICFLISGCSPNRSAPQEPLALVTAVEITYNYRQTQLRRHYTSSDKMDVILYYLYDLSPYGEPEEDPEQLQEDSCKIAVHLSDGNSRIYRQNGSRYLSVDSRPWQKISPTKGAVLFHLIYHIESDL